MEVPCDGGKSATLTPTFPTDERRNPLTRTYIVAVVHLEYGTFGENEQPGCVPFNSFGILGMQKHRRRAKLSTRFALIPKFSRHGEGFQTVLRERLQG